MSKFADFFAEADQPKFVSRMAGVMARNTADANRKASVMRRPQGETWKPEYEQEPALEAPMVSPDDLIGTGIPTKLAGLATMGANAMAGHGAMGGLLGTFIGKGAKTWDALAAEKAKQLLETGADPRKVWSETGTFKGVDGHLRQEIPDNVSPSRIDMTQEALFSYPKVGEYLQHKPLYQAYPEIKGISLANVTSNSNGAWLPDQGVIELSAPTRGNQTMQTNQQSHSTALHELQHVIQGKEGWARGGNPQQFQDYRGALERAANNNGFDPITGDYDFAIKDQISRFGESPFGAYERLAGEAEARATQTRMGMSMAERLQKYPYDSYDVPVDQLIVRGQR